ncbi:oxysterol-binding protein-related protein 5-like [Chanos chanos]|uniref:Oxysterol-binding protein-related protein 5-like n=1 Tax=Chanos chanos TaxID=29144 RepID=A0A6J2WYC4_CHACN|nr:oxysterol-binding protein-related protein 5-like [Chanos chanos]
MAQNRSMQKSNPVEKIKKEDVLGQRFPLCPALSSPKRHGLQTPNLCSREHGIYPLSPGGEVDPRVITGQEKEVSYTIKSPDRKNSLRVQKKNYKQEKRRATKELFSALKDPTVVIMSNWLKIRSCLKSWMRLWCVLKPGVLLIYKSPAVEHWVGTVLLNACRLIQRPSKKDGFCFKVFHPLDLTIWAAKGPRGENVGSITQPLPSTHLICRAMTQSDGHCWMDALELALSCSSLYKLTSWNCRDTQHCFPSESSNILSFLHADSLDLLRNDSPNLSHTDSPLNESCLGHNHTETDGCSDQSECDVHEESDMVTKQNGDQLLNEESYVDQSDDPCPETDIMDFDHAGSEEGQEEEEEEEMERVLEENRGVMWTLLSQLCVGMDPSKLTLPVFTLEPRSLLDRLSDYYGHTDLLSEAVGEENAYSRMKKVLCWYFSGFDKHPKVLKRPFSPVLGETFRCSWLHPQTESCTLYIAEQVSYQPPVSAFYVWNKKDGFCITGNILPKSKYYGNSLSEILDGRVTLLFLSHGEEYIFTLPYSHCKGLFYGKMTTELGGKITIDCEKTKCMAEVEFKLKPVFGSSSQKNQVSGTICIGDQLLATVEGHWDKEIFLCERGTGKREMLWNSTPQGRRQRLKRRVILPDQQGPLESARLWRHVSDAVLSGDQRRAVQERYVVEETQRWDMRVRGDDPWTPHFFRLDPVTNQWIYKHAQSKQCDADVSALQCVRNSVNTKTQPVLSSQSFSPQQAKPQGKYRRSSQHVSSCGQTMEISSSEPLHKPPVLTGMTNCNVLKFTLLFLTLKSLSVLSQQLYVSDHSDHRMVSSRNCLIIFIILLLQLLISYMST